jgi:hypothetical protein
MKKNRCCAITIKGRVCKNNKKDSSFCNIHRDNETCVICLEHLKKPKTLTNCSHKFCEKCISKWLYLEQTMTCPLCRSYVSCSEDIDAFEYCFNNKIISRIKICSYIILNEELKEYITRVLNFNSDYTYDEWEIFKNYLSLNQEMYNLFYSSELIHYEFFQKFDENNPGIIENGRSTIHHFRICDF